MADTYWEPTKCMGKPLQPTVPCAKLAIRGSSHSYRINQQITLKAILAQEIGHKVEGAG